MMSSQCWITTFACLALFILPSRGDVVVDTPNIGLFWNKVYFSDTQFTDFYQCLRNRETSSCTAWFKYFDTFLFIRSYRVTTISKSTINPTYQIDLLFHKCIVTMGDIKKIVCEKTSINCDDKNKYQRFNLTTGSFNNNCVGITSDDTFQIKKDDRFKTCQGDCYDGFSMTTATNNDVTTTIIPITAIPTPDTKDPVVTATTMSLAQDTTNLTESLKKESNTEKNTGIIVGVTVTLIILIVLIVLAIFFWRKLKQHRKTPEGNHQVSNFGMSRDTMDMGGYQNTHNMRGEEVSRTGQVATPNTYSNADYRNQDVTTNSNHKEITSVDDFSPPNPFLPTADSTYEILQDEGEASLPPNTSSTTDYSNIQTTDGGSNAGSPYAVVMKRRDLKPSPGDTNIKTTTKNNNNNNNSADSNAEDVTVDMPSPYSLAASDSVHLNSNNDSNSSLPVYDPVHPKAGSNSVETKNTFQTYDGTSSPYSMEVSNSFIENSGTDNEATAPTYNTPDTPNTYSKLHENVRNMKNPYDALINAEGNSGKNNSQSDLIHSSQPTNEITEYSLARPDLAIKNGHNSSGIESCVTEPNSSLVSGYGSEEESDRSEGFDFTGVRNGDTDKNPYFELEKVE